jgi:calcineurin-like phosphoesterase family protein
MIKIDVTNLRNVFFSADLHLNHTREFIYEARGYSSPKMHTDSVLDIINQNIRRNDIFFVLGDFCLNTTREEFEHNIDQIECDYIYYIWGNHNSQLRDAYKEAIFKNYNLSQVDLYPVTHKNITFLGNYSEVCVNGQYITLCHYPINSWNNMNRGSWNLYGHTHEVTDLATGKSLNVGWDMHKKPLSFDEVKTIMDKKCIKMEGHH